MSVVNEFAAVLNIAGNGVKFPERGVQCLLTIGVLKHIIQYLVL